MTDDRSPDQMTPRITIRDSDDALLLLMALRTYAYAMQEELRAASRKPGADQFALSTRMIDETETITTLMSAITDGIVTETDENPTENKD